MDASGAEISDTVAGSASMVSWLLSCTAARSVTYLIGVVRLRLVAI
jgi:hypothetical protein